MPICWFGVSRIDKPGDGDSTSRKINDGSLTRGAATDLMGEVGDALAAQQIASVSGERS